MVNDLEGSVKKLMDPFGKNHNHIKLRESLVSQHERSTTTTLNDFLNRVFRPRCGLKVFILFGQLGNQLQGIFLRLYNRLKETGFKLRSTRE